MTYSITPASLNHMPSMEGKGLLAMVDHAEAVSPVSVAWCRCFVNLYQDLGIGRCEAEILCSESFLDVTL